MPVFPSDEWCQALVRAIHSEPDSLKAGKGFVGDFAAVVLPEPPHLKAPFVIWGRAVEGRIEGLRPLEDLDEVEELAPAYVARAGFSTWRRLIVGELDPVEAVLQRTIGFAGDLAPIIERAHFKELVRRVLDKVPTRAKESLKMALGDLKSRTVGMLGKAVERVLADEKRAAKVAQAVGAVQKGKERLDRAQESFLKGLGVATRADYKDVGKRLSALKRRVRHLAARLEKRAP